MTDEELIAHLRLQGLDKDIAAADRIEQLVNDNHRWKKECEEFWRKREDAAEAKLAKAVEALAQTDQTIMFHTDDTSFRVWGEDAVIDIRKALAELEKTE